jgi:carbonic anhydrase
MGLGVLLGLGVWGGQHGAAPAAEKAPAKAAEKAPAKAAEHAAPKAAEKAPAIPPVHTVMRVNANPSRRASTHSPATISGHGAAGVDPDEALSRLLAGNRRFVAGKTVHPDLTLARMRSLAAGQHPFAVVLGCSDSRVPPELVFDQGLGSLFIVRDAGNSVNDEVLGSIEYAVEHLSVKLVVVLGHEKCGAVSAAVAGGEAPGHIKALVERLAPAVEASKAEAGDKVHNCVLSNARMVAKQLRQSKPILEELVNDGKVRVVAADYDVATGRVALVQ